MPRIRLSNACRLMFLEMGIPVQTRYATHIAIASIFRDGGINGATIYAKEDHPSDQDYRRVIKQLTEERRISPDPDFGNGVFRINELPDGPAETICALVDPFCYISHLSAMENYGLTDRIPDQLTLTTPERTAWRESATRCMSDDQSRFGPYLAGFTRLAFRNHSTPKSVRKRKVTVHRTKHPGPSISLRDGTGRISTVGRTFSDMLSEPQLCGGMRHVLETWENEVSDFLEDTVSAIDSTKSGIVKVRAGYILEERMGIKHPTIKGWRAFTQRGGSRKLDPAGEYRPSFSDVWMISINA